MNILKDFYNIFRGAIKRILSLYFRIIPVPKSLIENKNKLTSICIITESESIIIEALLHSFAKRIENKRITHFLSNDKPNVNNSIKWTSLNNNHSLENILNSEKTLELATFNLFSGRGPYKANPAYRLGFWELLGILFLGRFLIIFLGEPFTLKKLHITNLTNLRRILRIDFYKNHKQVRGTPFLSIQAQEKIILGGNEFQNDINQLSEKLSLPRSTVLRKARHAFYEIAANPRRPMYRILAASVRFINKRLFSSIQSLGLEKLKSAVREKTVVLVPMHRSHLDYLLIGSELYQAHFIPPLVAAGINLSFWPAGFLIRSVGAYFVKRNVGSDRLHALILKRYVSYLVKRGHMQEFFIEGGRSRSGRMRQPKIGLLNIMVDAYSKGYKDDIAFVPVSITYENVIEDTVYGDENTGQEKTKESLFGLFKAGGILRRRYGDVMINFGPAISIKDYIKNGINADTKMSVTNFAQHLTRKIREQTNPSLTSLIHTALLLSTNYGLNRKDLIQTVSNLGKLLGIAKELNPSIGESTPALKHFLEGQHSALEDLSLSNTIKSGFTLGKQIYYIPGQRRFTADFYKNSTLHIFFECGIFSLLDFLKMNISSENVENFYNIFVYDFILPNKIIFMEQCISLISHLLAQGILEKNDNFISFKNREPGIYIPRLLKSNIENLAWCIAVLSSLSAKNPSLEQEEDSENKLSIDYNLAMNALLNEFRIAAYIGKTKTTEASSSVSINSALETLQNMGVIYVANKQSKNKKIIIKELKSPKLDLILKANTLLNASIEN